MDTLEIGKRLVELCSAGESRRAVEELYADDCVSIEAKALNPKEGRERRGKDVILAAHDRWVEMFDVRGEGYTGPYPHDDEFLVPMWCEITGKIGDMKGRDVRVDEVGRYKVRDGKIREVRFYYDMGT